MGQRYLLDTNIAIYFLNGVLPSNVLLNIQPLLQVECNLSIITKMEMLGWQFPSAQKLQETEDFIHASSVYRLTDPIADQAILIRRNIRIKLPDAIIAATAIVNDFVLLTRNESDFSKIAELNFINPFN